MRGRKIRGKGGGGRATYGITTLSEWFQLGKLGWGGSLWNSNAAGKSAKKFTATELTSIALRMECRLACENMCLHHISWSLGGKVGYRKLVSQASRRDCTFNIAARRFGKI